MFKIFGTASLVISKLTNLPLRDAKVKFDETNVKRVFLHAEMMDGSVHKFEVMDHFGKWEDDIEMEE